MFDFLKILVISFFCFDFSQLFQIQIETRLLPTHCPYLSQQTTHMYTHICVFVSGQAQLPMLALYKTCKTLTWVTASTSVRHIIHLNKQTPWIILFVSNVLWSFEREGGRVRACYYSLEAAKESSSAALSLNETHICCTAGALGLLCHILTVCVVCVWSICQDAILSFSLVLRMLYINIQKTSEAIVCKIRNSYTVV